MIVPFDSERAHDPGVAGGKGSALAALHAAGFPVPNGFVVTSRDVSRDALAEMLALLGAGDESVRVAVRSSGLAEDAADASFAGQFDTLLDVAGTDAVARAVAHCFDSFSSERAAAYRRQRGISDTRGAVVVQRMVNATAAGVAFTLDPVTGESDRVVIDAAPGLGVAVVSGQVTPDRFVVAKSAEGTITRRIAGAQTCLDDALVRAVADLARRVEQHRGEPVDIEWALEGGEVRLLQARPVTAVASPAALEQPPESWTPELNTAIDERFPLYSNGNVSEILPGCVTPLTYSIFSRGVERSFRDVAETIGSMPDVGPAPIVVGFFYHRVYLNVSYFMTAADNSPGATRDTVYEDLIGPPPERTPAWRARDFLPWRLTRGLRIIGRFLALQKRLDADIAECRKRYDDEVQRFARRHPTERSADEIATWLTADDGLLPAIVHIRASQFATSSFGSLRGLTRRWLGDTTGVLASSLVTGIGSLGSANPAAGLYALAERVRGDAMLAELFAQEQDDARVLAQLRSSSDPAAAAFLEAFATFLEQFGHRGFREAEFRSPIWAERPESVIAHLRVHLTPGSVAPDEIARRQHDVAEAARRDAVARLRGWKRSFFEGVLTSARKHIAAREEMKDLLLRFIHLTRRMIAAAQLRLADTLEQPDDIYFLLDSELAGILRGEWARDAVRARVSARRKDFEWSRAVDVPKVQDGVVRRLSAPEVAASGALEGIPVSPGVVEGIARLVLDPTHAAIAPGEILVAPVTDVAWTPLFLRAAGLVVDVGGPLSHGSIVAREFGIPAVTAVAGATQRIRTGDRIRVDGSRGIVSLLEKR